MPHHPGERGHPTFYVIFWGLGFRGDLLGFCRGYPYIYIYKERERERDRFWGFIGALYIYMGVL